MSEYLDEVKARVGAASELAASAGDSHAALMLLRDVARRMGEEA